MTATSMYHVTPKPDHLLVRPFAALDAGNRTTQWITPTGKVMTIPSVIKKLEPWEEAEFDEESVFVEVRDSDGNTTERFVIGAEAQSQKGTPAFEVNKVELAKHFIYATLEPSATQSTVVIECLRIALPDARNLENVALLKELEGVYEFIRNGKHIVASVRHIEPVDETRPAYHYAKENGLFQSPKSLNGILDLGGGTGIGRLYSPSGSLNRQADVIVPGTYSLAEKIDAALLPTTGFSQDLGLIMDAIENGTFTIGTSGIGFADLFEKCRNTWLEDIRGKLRTKWGQYFSEIGEVLIIGGSASLAAPIQKSTNGRFKVAANPQTMSIKGMIL
ncbi:MAG: hypothetical protein HC836_37570 [Richelia sp. RM2_1_2]|nr:hypothetical protein [Richelia sp. SM2_1_7]NJN12413.1 hypothetical protein [Richelia sp. RM1_1_1]NJO30146.1 hypothetical protein [Richelia sp. SL_2_1]NJO63696.1 hypothetical protein [Richelia sp. RM2_1_2]